jgi:hypothetical protein
MDSPVENPNDKSKIYCTSSSEYEDEINDIVGDFSTNMRKFSNTLRQGFTTENEIKRQDYEPFDIDKIKSTANNNNRKNNYEKLKSKTKKIPDSLRRVSFG